jgi:hypothetical protein
MDTFKEPFVFLMLDAESIFVGIDEILFIILWNANIFNILKYCLDYDIWTKGILWVDVMKSTIGEIAGFSPSHLRCFKLQGF